MNRNNFFHNKDEIMNKKHYNNKLIQKQGKKIFINFKKFKKIFLVLFVLNNIYKCQNV